MSRELQWYIRCGMYAFMCKFWRFLQTWNNLKLEKEIKIVEEVRKILCLTARFDCLHVHIFSHIGLQRLITNMSFYFWHFQKLRSHLPLLCPVRWVRSLFPPAILRVCSLLFKNLLGSYFKMLDSKAECAVPKCRLRPAVSILRDIKIPYYSLHPIYIRFTQILSFAWFYL